MFQPMFLLSSEEHALIAILEPVLCAKYDDLWRSVHTHRFKQRIVEQRERLARVCVRSRDNIAFMDRVMSLGVDPKPTGQEWARAKLDLEYTSQPCADAFAIAILKQRIRDA